MEDEISYLLEAERNFAPRRVGIFPTLQEGRHGLPASSVLLLPETGERTATACFPPKRGKVIWQVAIEDHASRLLENEMEHRVAALERAFERMDAKLDRLIDGVEELRGEVSYVGRRIAAVPTAGQMVTIALGLMNGAFALLKLGLA